MVWSSSLQLGDTICVSRVIAVLKHRSRRRLFERLRGNPDSERGPILSFKFHIHVEINLFSPLPGRKLECGYNSWNMSVASALRELDLSQRALMGIEFYTSNTLISPVSE